MLGFCFKNVLYFSSFSSVFTSDDVEFSFSIERVRERTIPAISDEIDRVTFVRKIFQSNIIKATTKVVNRYAEKATHS